MNKNNNNTIYENILIGSFIFQLGAKSQEKNLVNNSSINLFQQTPSDPQLSDLIAGINNKYLIIEFKKDTTNKDNKEDKKLKKLNNALEKEENTHLLDISKKCHFLGTGTKDEDTKTETILFKSYVNQLELDNIQYKHHSFINYILFEYDEKIKDYSQDIMQSLSDEVGNVSENDFKEYIELLKNIYKIDKSTSTAGIIIIKDENNNLKMIPTENIENLILERAKNMELSQNKSINI